MQLFYLIPVNLWLMFPSRAEHSGIGSKLLCYRSRQQGWVKGKGSDQLRRWQLFLREGFQCLLEYEYSHIRAFHTRLFGGNNRSLISFLLMETELYIYSRYISKDNHCCLPPGLLWGWNEIMDVKALSKLAGTTPVPATVTGGPRSMGRFEPLLYLFLAMWLWASDLNSPSLRNHICKVGMPASQSYCKDWEPLSKVPYTGLARSSSP